MRILDHYIARSVGATVAMVLLVLAGLDTVFAFIAELEDLSRAYQSVEAAVYSAATLPRRVYEFIPVATLIGCLQALGALANNSELVIVRAAGISVYRIVYSVLKPVFIVVCFGLVLGQFIMPFTEQFAQSYRALKQGGGTVLRVKHGNWHREGNDFIHINAIEPNGVMHGITRYQFDDGNRLVATSFTQRADYKDGYWEMLSEDVTRFDERAVTATHFQSTRWMSRLTPDVLDLVVLKPDYLSITGLFRYADYLAEQGLSHRPYRLAFWKKIMQPWATLVMVIIAISFIFGPLRSVTMGLRVMVGLVVGLVFNYSQDFLGHASLVFRMEPWIAATIPVLIFWIVGILLVRRVR